MKDTNGNLDIRCFGCLSTLKELGGLLFSPPTEPTSSDNVDQVDKFHLCKDCFPKILDFIMGEESPDYVKGNPTLKTFGVKC